MIADNVTLPPALGASVQRKPASRGGAVTGFAAGSLIRTIFGQCRVEALMAGDLLLDATGQIVELRGIRKRRVHARDSIQLDPTALGLGMAPGRLDRPVVVGAGQKLAIRDWRSEILFARPAMTTARALVDGVHVRRGVAGHVTLYHLQLDQGCILLADGLQALVAASAPDFTSDARLRQE
ncbi:MAG: Hint domain-containing protein [Rhodobacteraceae bacterium]|nr:Hint domain-containing protein [Paracoccaceae bacterium]